MGRKKAKAPQVQVVAAGSKRNKKKNGAKGEQGVSLYPKEALSGSPFPVYNARQKAAMGFATKDKVSLAFLRGITEEEHKFQCSLVHHLMNRSLLYPLPSLVFDGMARTSGMKVQVPTSGGTIAGFFRTGGSGTGNPIPTGVLSSIVQDDVCLTSQYGIYNGRINSTINLACNAGTMFRFFIIFDPTFSDYPVTVISLRGDNPDSGLFLEEAHGWTNTPFVGVGTFSSGPLYGGAEEVDTELCKCKDKKAHGESPAVFTNVQSSDDNLVYPGGYSVSLTAENITAFTSVAMRIRDEHNSAHSFNNICKLGSGNLSSDSFFMTNSYIRTTTATAFYSGSQWTLAKKHLAIPSGQGSALVKIQTAIMNGYPFFDLVLSNSGGSNTSITFNLSVNGWQDVAPLDPGVAGSMSLETVPFKVPSWFMAGRTSSTLQSPAVARGIVSQIPGVVLSSAIAEAPDDAKKLIELENEVDRTSVGLGKVMDKIAEVVSTPEGRSTISTLKPYAISGITAALKPLLGKLGYDMMRASYGPRITQP